MSSNTNMNTNNTTVVTGSGDSNKATAAAVVDAAVSRILNNNFDVDSKTCILTLIKVLDNVLQQPNNDKVRTIRLNNPNFAKKVVEKQGHYVLMACGFNKTTTNNNMSSQPQEEFLTLDGESEDTQLIVHTRHVLTQVAIHQLQCPADAIPTFLPPKPKIQFQQTTNAAGFTSTTTNTGFNIYQGQRYDGQSAAVGTNLGPPQGWKSKTEQQLSKLQQQKAKLEEKLQQAAGGRDWTVLLPGQQQSRTNTNAATSLPYASTTSMNNNKEDVQLLAQHIQKQQKARIASENQGFTTKAMRDLEKLKRANVYSHTQLAIQFPNAIIVKANFLPQETVQAVIDGLREEILIQQQDNDGTILLPSLELYVTPPRRLLEANKKLHELDLVPAAKVYVSWKSPLPSPPNDNNNNNNIAWFIQPDKLLPQSSSTSTHAQGPAMPTSMPIVQKDNDYNDTNNNNNGEDDKKSTTKTTTVNKRKKTKADKESTLLARMLGK
ncbi:PUB domain containing protein [Nitzschia inconspicua]|uniref:PUB domain containing protein n=1 Tax=Nitzschia inconspicua TaxID=303405 RepID=A0A9K3L4C6_9STRA|nr:PUB domain containing protein [Nitzschia inconspicua]